MKISLFKKYLAITLSILLAAFIILGTFLMTFVCQYWSNYEFNQMRGNINGMSKLVATCVETSNGKLTVADADSWELMQDMINGNSYDLILIDSDGMIVSATREENKIKNGGHVPDNIISKLIKDKYYENRTTTSGLFSDTRQCVAVPVRVQVSATVTTAGYIILCSSKEDDGQLPSEIFRIFIYAVIASLIVSIVLAGLFSYRQSRPLKQMSEQARRIAKGDFTSRIHVKRKDEVGKLTVAFNDMADALDKEEQVRRDFIANISHELKTPMTTIAGFIDGILDGTIPKIKQDHYLAIVSEEIGRLSVLVNSMLSLARIDSGKTTLNKSTFSILDVIVVVLMSFEDRIEKKNIQISGLETADGLQAYGDQTLIHQVMYNLIENAVKFTPEGGNITFAMESRDGRLYFAVKNDGKGIAEDDLPFIFDKFYKTDKSRSEDKKSMGLGLYIVKTIIKLHGGDITASSVVDKETCFSGYIPENTEE